MMELKKVNYSSPVAFSTSKRNRPQDWKQCAHQDAVATYIKDLFLLKSTSVAGRKRTAAARLLAGLGRLEVAIAGLPRERRRSMIETMSPCLRLVLLRRMEAMPSSSVRRGMACKKVRASPEEVPSKRKGDVSSTSKRLRRKLAGVIDNAALSSPRTSRGVCQVRTAWGPRYFARITIGGVAISSSCVHTLREAEIFQTFFIKLKEATPDRGPLKPSLVAEMAAMRLRFRATINARRWVGRTLSSPQVSSLTEALALQSKLEKARQQGWEALRAVWVECLQVRRHSGRFGHGTLSQEEAEARARSLEVDRQCSPAAPRARCCRAAFKQSIADASRQRGTTRRTEVRLRRLVDRLERLLRAVERAAEACSRRSRDIGCGRHVTTLTA